MGPQHQRLQGENPRVVTSLQNERVKAIRSLKMRKVRRETKLFVAEGVSVLETARQVGWSPETLVFLKGSERDGVAKNLIQHALEKGAECLEVSSAILAKLSGKDNPQTILGMFSQRWSPLPEIQKLHGKSVILALDEIRDPGNLGSIVRTVDAVGANHIVLIGSCCDPYSPEAVRASMGSIFSVTITAATQDTFCTWCKNWLGDITGLHLEGTEDFRDANYRHPILVMMGSEGRGLSPALSQRCTRLVKIPMAGSLDSLNVSVATALTLYQVCGPDLRLKNNAH